MQFGHDLAHAHPAGTNARSHRIDVAVVRRHRDLRAMSWFAGASFDLDIAVDKFWNFEFEQPLHKAWVGSRHNNLWAFCSATHLNDVGLAATAVVIAFVLHLLGLRQQCFNSTKVEEGVPRVGLLHDAGDDFTFTACELFVFAIAFDFANALGDDLFCGLRGDTSEVLRRVVPFANDHAFFIELKRNHTDLASFRVDFDLSFFSCTRKSFICGHQRVREREQQIFFRDAALHGEGAQRFHHVGVLHDFVISLVREVDEFAVPVDFEAVVLFIPPGFAAPCFDPAGFDVPGFGVGPHSKTVCAAVIASNAIAAVTP